MNLLLRLLSAIIILPGFLWLFYKNGWGLLVLIIGMLGFSLAEFWKMVRKKPSYALAILGTLYITAGISSLYLLRLHVSFSAVLLVLIATWSSDTFAYFAGRAFGKHKLAPSISPQKTWEGVLGGTLGAVLMPFVLQDFLTPLGAQDFLWVSLPCAILAPAGDLIESWVKRLCKVKDSGALLPGHGGVLDRIDALLLTAPWAYLYFSW